ncbi:hypothetical protein MTR67_046132 [Solanum verrucosum]|uniref:Methyltransferase n=1 Tax=Solanum verrucosum TaxID=315347 RepID=A0AAF0UUC6_SOLVR|nr:hypothetical protein MTR67_046132 [Solanum verrucosum]
MPRCADPQQDATYELVRDRFLSLFRCYAIVVGWWQGNRRMGIVFISSLACERLVHPSTTQPRGSKIDSSLQRYHIDSLILLLKIDRKGLERISESHSLLSKAAQGIDREKFLADTIYWQDQVRHYWRLMNVEEKEIRNVMDMSASLGGFAVGLNTWPVWVMNVVPITMNDTLSAVYGRGLTGVFHDWCESFSTYPRTYDLLHANHLLSHYKNREEGCLIEDIMLEMDRILRPQFQMRTNLRLSSDMQGFIIIRDEEPIISRIQALAPKFLWDVELHFLENHQRKTEPVLFCRKKFWAIA